MNLKKVIQVVGLLLQKYSGRLNYTKLIKLLYLADREALGRWDVPITEDSYAALHNGPIVSEIYNLVMERHCDPTVQFQWNALFATEGYELVAQAPSLSNKDELSEREEQLLNEIDAKFHDWTFGQLIDYTHNHDLFPEWEDPGNSSYPISLSKLLQALGRSEEEIAEVLSNEAAFQKDQQAATTGCT
jgi:uncharacterized phage-associated protein